MENWQVVLQYSTIYLKKYVSGKGCQWIKTAQWVHLKAKHKF